MDRGLAFLKRQVYNAVIQHGTFLSALEAHADQVDDPRLSALCSRHIPAMREHQRMLEEYQSQLGGESRIAKTVIGTTVAVVRDLADAARESDYVRLVGDVVMARQSEDAFKTFREAGKMMGNRTLQEIGDIGERRHDAYVKEANRLVQHMFVEHVQGVDGVARPSAFTHLDATT
jgi:ferritin-like metal-binding protein YciE